MGNEASGTAHFGKKKLTGKALLETSEILFDSPTAAHALGSRSSRSSQRKQSMENSVSKVPRLGDFRRPTAAAITAPAFGRPVRFATPVYVSRLRVLAAATSAENASNIPSSRDKSS